MVVGAGPAGCKVAADLAGTHDVLVLEEHAVSGIPMQCTGLLSHEAIGMSGVRPRILNELHGAHVHFPGGAVVTARSREPKAALVMRDEVDSLMASEAKAAGAEIRYSERYLGHTVRDGLVSVETTGGRYEAKAVIGADGHRSAVSMAMGNNPPRYFVRGIQVDLEHAMGEQDMMVIRLGSSLAPGFFTWQIPFGERTRVGLAVGSGYGPPAPYLKRLLAESGLESARVVGKHSGIIPLEYARKTYGDGSMLIGDSAGHVKPVSGGGLHPAFVASGVLSRVFREADSRGDFSAGFLSAYERGWKRAMGGELGRGRLLRRLYDAATDADLDRAAEIVERRGLSEILDGIDLDRPSKVAMAVLARPLAALGLLPTALRCFLGALR